ncbi:MAG: hypothetical protein DRP35_08420 [Candidatus Zixiibacteriota bacterium]|nr:MAG: hypothetical protein DRP35_08420 [candidate division Zixibacteria bacterium]
MKLFWHIFLFSLLIMSSLAAQGEHGDGLFLMKIEQGASATGMGVAVVSLNGDPNFTEYNPAGAVGVEKFTVSFGHNDYWENIRLESGYFAKNLNDRWYLHGKIRYATVDKLELRQSPSSIPDGYFEAQDVSFKSGLAYQINNSISAGFAIGWFVEKIGSYRGSTFNVDFGLQNKINENITLGASVTNLGKHFRIELEGTQRSNYITLPTSYRFGGSYKFDKYLGALDFVYIDEELKTNFGAVGKLHEYITARVGYMLNYDSKNFTAGLSFNFNNMTVDYGFVPFKNNLGTSHSFNLTFSL